MGRRRIVIVDLLLSWPPRAGAFVDTVNLATRLAREAEVLLILPRLTAAFPLKMTGLLDLALARFSDFFTRGQVRGLPPIRTMHLPLTGVDFFPSRLARRVRPALEDFRPDVIFLSNGWHAKVLLPPYFRDLAPVVLRIYAHEGLCTLADGWFFRRGAVCRQDHFRGPFSTCLKCCLNFYLRLPAPIWLHEYLAAGAFLPAYPRKVREGVQACRTIMVTNHWTRDRLAPHHPDVRVVPIGGEIGRFRARYSRGIPTPVHCAVPGRVQEERKGGRLLHRLLEECRGEIPGLRFKLTTAHRMFQLPNVDQVGWLTPERLPEFYASCDFALVPSRWPEPQPLVGVEALAAGLPLLAFEVGGLADLPEPGVSGFLIPPYDLDELKEKMTLLVRDSGLRRAMGQAAAARAAIYDADRIYQEQVRSIFGLE